MIKANGEPTQSIWDNKSCFWIFFAILALLSLYTTFLYGSVYDRPGYDYYFHLKRFEALITAINEGTFPFYIDHDVAFGYGYLSRVFYSDVILIPFALIGVVCGASSAYEVMLFTMTILCGLFMYSAINTIFKNRFAAFIGAILYTFSVYRLFDVYNRGALGEVFAFTFIPIVFLGLYHIVKGDYKKWYIIAIGFSLLIFSHVISTVLTFITVTIIAAICYKPLIKEPKRIYFLILAGVVTLIITSSYILPLIEQMQSNTFRYESNDWALPSRAKLPFSYVLWALTCGFVYPKEITIVGIGILLCLFLFLRFFIKEKSTLTRSVDIGVFIGLFYIIASSAIFPWGRFPFTLLSFIQYPSRLFLLVTFLFAIAGGYYLSKVFLKEKARWIAASVVIILTSITIYAHQDNFGYMYAYHIKQSNEYPTTGNFFYLNGAEYISEKVPSATYIQSRGDSVIFKYNFAEIANLHRDKGILYMDVVASDINILELPLFYYKGYVATLDNEEIPIRQSDNGLVELSIINKSDKLEVFYSATSTQKISWYLSLMSIFALCVYIFIQKKRFK
jgi:6-pyruvoyl-tetrahydropterin synthase related domain; membrane protein.